MKNYFRGTVDHPYHLSVGAVIVNNEGQICCHHFGQKTDGTPYEGFTDFYLLMRETLEMGETIEAALRRGMMEEFGITGEIETYLGSIKSSYQVTKANPVVMIEKTTLYFLVKTKTFDPILRSKEDFAMGSEIEWLPSDFLINKMKEWGRRYENTTLDESSILERLPKTIKSLSESGR